MTNAEMHTIQVQDTPMLLQSTLAPVLKLLGEALVEATDRTGAGSHSHQGFGHFSDFVRTRPSDKHLGESLCDLWLIAAVALEDLRVELALTISGNLQLLDPPGRSDQVAGVEPVAIAFALGAALAPADSDQRV